MWREKRPETDFQLLRNKTREPGERKPPIRSLIPAGRTVEINDAFRIGPLNSGKVRPIVVKLMNIWDKRLVLSNSTVES